MGLNLIGMRRGLGQENCGSKSAGKTAGNPSTRHERSSAGRSDLASIRPRYYNSSSGRLN
jgi:hypothetical protein